MHTKSFAKHKKHKRKIKHPTSIGHVIKEATTTCGQLTFIIVKKKNGYDEKFNLYEIDDVLSLVHM
jgi:hypothetical protein